MAKNQKTLDLSLLSGKKSVKEDNYEVQDLEMLLKMSDDSAATAKAGTSGGAKSQ